MTIAVVAVVVAVLIVLVIVTRNSSRMKKEARADLQREMEALPHRDIMDLVREEAEETGVTEIPGGEGVELPVLLQAWHRDAAARAACPDRSSLVFVVDDGADRARLTVEQIRLTFDGYVPAPVDQPPIAEEPATEGAAEPADEELDGDD